MKTLKPLLLLSVCLAPLLTSAVTLNVGDTAPLFTTLTHEGAKFSMADQKKRWTVLYFYPKAETPGCTKQACAYRDKIKAVTDEGADIFGISSDSVAQQAAFHKNHHLTFTLLADPDSRVIGLYGSKMPIMKMSRRWTFIIDPDLKIRDIERDVDPAMDADRVAKRIHEMKAQP